MSSATGGYAPSEDGVFITMPEGWCIVDIERLLDAELPRLISAALSDDPDAPDTVALSEEFRALRERVANERMLLIAVRRRTRRPGHDVVTFAVLSASAAQSSDTPSSLDTRTAGQSEVVALSDQNAVVYRMRPLAGGGSYPSCVQVQLRISSGLRAGILTLLSSEPGVERELVAEGMIIAESIDHGSGRAAETASAGA